METPLTGHVFKWTRVCVRERLGSKPSREVLLDVDGPLGV